MRVLPSVSMYVRACMYACITCCIIGQQTNVVVVSNETKEDVPMYT